MQLSDLSSLYKTLHTRPTLAIERSYTSCTLAPHATVVVGRFVHDHGVGAVEPSCVAACTTPRRHTRTVTFRWQERHHYGVSHMPQEHPSAGGFLEPDGGLWCAHRRLCPPGRARTRSSLGCFLLECFWPGHAVAQHGHGLFRHDPGPGWAAGAATCGDGSGHPRGPTPHAGRHAADLSHAPWRDGTGSRRASPADHLATADRRVWHAAAGGAGSARHGSVGLSAPPEHAAQLEVFGLLYSLVWSLHDHL